MIVHSVPHPHDNSSERLRVLPAAKASGEGVAFDEVVHVGDDLTSDVLGAQRVGCRTVHYLPVDRRTPPPPEAGNGSAADAGRTPPDATVAVSTPAIITDLRVFSERLLCLQTLMQIVDVIALWNGGGAR